MTSISSLHIPRFAASQNEQPQNRRTSTYRPITTDTLALSQDRPTIEALVKALEPLNQLQTHPNIRVISRGWQPGLLGKNTMFAYFEGEEPNINYKMTVTYNRNDDMVNAEVLKKDLIFGYKVKDLLRDEKASPNDYPLLARWTERDTTLGARFRPMGQKNEDKTIPNGRGHVDGQVKGMLQGVAENLGLTPKLIAATLNQEVQDVIKELSDLFITPDVKIDKLEWTKERLGQRNVLTVSFPYNAQSYMPRHVLRVALTPDGRIAEASIRQSHESTCWDEKSKHYMKKIEEDKRELLSFRQGRPPEIRLYGLVPPQDPQLPDVSDSVRSFMEMLAQHVVALESGEISDLSLKPPI